MPKLKMSDTDKIKRICKKSELIDIENASGIKKIRSKKLRQFILCKLMELYFLENPKDAVKSGLNPSKGAEFYQNVLTCSKRESYDFWNTDMILNSLQEKIESKTANFIINAQEDTKK